MGKVSGTTVLGISEKPPPCFSLIHPPHDAPHSGEWPWGRSPVKSRLPRFNRGRRPRSAARNAVEAQASNAQTPGIDRTVGAVSLAAPPSCIGVPPRTSARELKSHSPIPFLRFKLQGRAQSIPSVGFVAFRGKALRPPTSFRIAPKGGGPICRRGILSGTWKL